MVMRTNETTFLHLDKWTDPKPNKTVAKARSTDLQIVEFYLMHVIPSVVMVSQGAPVSMANPSTVLPPANAE